MFYFYKTIHLVLSSHFFCLLIYHHHIHCVVRKKQRRICFVRTECVWAWVFLSLLQLRGMRCGITALALPKMDWCERYESEFEIDVQIIFKLVTTPLLHYYRYLMMMMGLYIHNIIRFKTIAANHILNVLHNF